MKLFLCSSFITPALKPDFEQFVGETIRRPRVACITTAFVEYKRIQSQKQDNTDDFAWFEAEIAVAREMLGWQVDLVDLNDVDSAATPSIFNNYDGIWVMGGLLLPLVQAVFEKKFNAYLALFLQQNTFYVGTSAGSMICADSLDAAAWYIGEPEPEVMQYRGLGLIPFQIYPHYNPEQLELIEVAKASKEEYWLLKDGQAIAIDEQGTRMCGGEITILRALS